MPGTSTIRIKACHDSQELLSTESFGTSMSTHHILGLKKVPRVRLPHFGQPAVEAFTRGGHSKRMERRCTNLLTGKAPQWRITLLAGEFRDESARKRGRRPFEWGRVSHNGHEDCRTDTPSTLPDSSTSSTSVVEEASCQYGPWMVVTRKKGG